MLFSSEIKLWLAHTKRKQQTVRSRSYKQWIMTLVTKTSLDKRSHMLAAGLGAKCSPRGWKQTSVGSPESSLKSAALLIVEFTWWLNVQKMCCSFLVWLPGFDWSHRPTPGQGQELTTQKYTEMSRIQWWAQSSCQQSPTTASTLTEAQTNWTQQAFVTVIKSYFCIWICIEINTTTVAGYTWTFSLHLSICSSWENTES